MQNANLQRNRAKGPRHPSKKSLLDFIPLPWGGKRRETSVKKTTFRKITKMKIANIHETSCKKTDPRKNGRRPPHVKINTNSDFKRKATTEFSRNAETFLSKQRGRRPAKNTKSKTSESCETSVPIWTGNSKRPKKND